MGRRHPAQPPNAGNTVRLCRSPAGVSSRLFSRDEPLWGARPAGGALPSPARRAVLGGEAGRGEAGRRGVASSAFPAQPPGGSSAGRRRCEVTASWWRSPLTLPSPRRTSRRRRPPKRWWPIRCGERGISVVGRREAEGRRRGEAGRGGGKPPPPPSSRRGCGSGEGSRQFVEPPARLAVLPRRSLRRWGSFPAWGRQLGGFCPGVVVRGGGRFPQGRRGEGAPAGPCGCERAGARRGGLRCPRHSHFPKPAASREAAGGAELRAGVIEPGRLRARTQGGRPGCLSRSWTAARAVFPDGVLKLRRSPVGESYALASSGARLRPGAAAKLGKGAGKVPCPRPQPGCLSRVSVPAPGKSRFAAASSRQTKWVRAHPRLAAALELS